MQNTPHSEIHEILHKLSLLDPLWKSKVNKGVTSHPVHIGGAKEALNLQISHLKLKVHLLYKYYTLRKECESPTTKDGTSRISKKEVPSLYNWAPSCGKILHPERTLNHVTSIKVGRGHIRICLTIHISAIHSFSAWLGRHNNVLTLVLFEVSNNSVYGLSVILLVVCGTVRLDVTWWFLAHFPSDFVVASRQNYISFRSSFINDRHIRKTHLIQNIYKSKDRYTYTRDSSKSKSVSLLKKTEKAMITLGERRKEEEQEQSLHIQGAKRNLLHAYYQK